MKRLRFAEEQIIEMLQEAEAAEPSQRRGLVSALSENFIVPNGQALTRVAATAVSALNMARSQTNLLAKVLVAVSLTIAKYVGELQ